MSTSATQLRFQGPRPAVRGQGREYSECRGHYRPDADPENLRLARRQHAAIRHGERRVLHGPSVLGFVLWGLVGVRPSLGLWGCFHQAVHTCIGWTALPARRRLFAPRASRPHGWAATLVPIGYMTLDSGSYRALPHSLQDC